MTKINLLPWRDALRQERKKQLTLAVIIAALFAIIVVYLVLQLINNQIDIQQERNRFLNVEIASLDQQIIDIQRLDNEKKRLIQQMDIIQRLQSSRPRVIKILDAFSKVVPKGVTLTKIERKGESITVKGLAQSSARISVFMRQIEQHPIFDVSDLQIVQREQQQQKFTLNIVEAELPAGSAI